MRGGIVAVLALAAALGAAPAAAQSVKDGVDAWQRGDYAGAVRAWQPLADGGDGDAAFDMAQAYKLGRGVPVDLARARTYYGTAARAGHVQGAANYGLLLFQDGDRKAAMPWIGQAADAGDPRAQYVLGTALFNGDLATKDWPRAYALMTRAAAAGLPQATTSLAQMDQYLSPADRQKGLRLATTLAARPVPPLGRQLVTAGAASPTAAAAPVVAMAVPARPAAPARASAAPRPAPARAPVAAAVPPPPAPSRGGGWQVQLGAYGSEAGAQTAWTSLSGKAAGLRGLRPAYQKAGAVVRLRATGLADRAAADRACAAAKAAGAACFPVAP